MLDELELQSGFARRWLLDSPMMTRDEEIVASYAELRRFADFVNQVDHIYINTLFHKLCGLKDIRTTIKNLKQSSVLDDIELFEVKHLAILSVDVRQLLAQHGMDGIVDIPALDRVIDILDPDGMKIATFYIYDSYCAQLKDLRVQMRQHPEQIDTFARKYAELFRQLHAIEVPTSGNIPSTVETARKQVEYISRYFPQENIDMLLSIVDSVPAGNRLLHMDLQTKNAMMQDNELMLIDMGELGYGHPMLDLGFAYSPMVSLVGDYEKIIGMPRELGQSMWNKAIDYYMEGLPADVVAERKAQIEVVSCVRNFSWLSLSDSFPEEVIMECKELFDERITKRYDYIKNVCKTFEHWTL